MKSRSRPFQCAIAGKTVGIALRHGGGLQEPSTVYVRCDERDCQYVDLNVAPCPLRTDMFADSSDGRTGDYLRRHAGTRVCYACLTDELGITHDQVRRASWRLKDEPGFSIRPSRCALCNRRRVTIALDGPASAPAPASSPVARDPAHSALAQALERYLRERPVFGFCAHCLARELTAAVPEVREAMLMLDREPVFQQATSQCVSCLLVKRVIRYEEQTSDEAPRRVIEALVQAAGASYCPTCVAFSADLPLADTRRILLALDGVSEFRRAEGVCDVCGRWQTTMRFHPDAAAGPGRLDDIEGVLTGHIGHRGLRIDLLSFRTAEGWRPFALVRTATGALVPNAPAIVLGVAPTKSEADELAAVQARQWIDKKVS